MSVKSCFGIIQRMGLDIDIDHFWGLIWRSDLHERLKLFLWRMASNVLPTKAVLTRRLGGGDTLCGLCGQEEEEVYICLNIAPCPELSGLLASGVYVWMLWKGRPSEI